MTAAIEGREALAIMTDYQPISCELYAELELAIVRKSLLRVGWRSAEGKERLEQLRPRDLQTRAHEEFLVAEDGQGRGLEIRLDRIVRFEVL